MATKKKAEKALADQLRERYRAALFNKEWGINYAALRLWSEQSIIATKMGEPPYSNRIPAFGELDEAGALVSDLLFAIDSALSRWDLADLRRMHAASRPKVNARENGEAIARSLCLIEKAAKLAPRQGLDLLPLREQGRFVCASDLLAIEMRDQVHPTFESILDHPYEVMGWLLRYSSGGRPRRDAPKPMGSAEILENINRIVRSPLGPLTRDSINAARSRNS